MFSSLFSTSAPVDPNAPNFHPVSSHFQPSELVGELEQKDLEWLCDGGFVTETQIFYNVLEDGTNIMCQVIHSSIGVWYPSIQFTCKIYNPNTNETIWKSINVSNFVTAPNGLDKRSCKADQFSITFKATPGAASPEAYTIRANLADDLQLSLEVARPAAVPGYKLGAGPKGGFSYFGVDAEKPEGYVVHRFWPHNVATGHIISRGQAIAARGPGMMVHAIQGMRPNLVAATWNFANFQSLAHGGVSAVQMEFTTIDAYGKKAANQGGVSVSVGSLVLGGKLAAVVAETKWPDEAQADGGLVQSRVTHLAPHFDADTGYQAPSGISFSWAGPSIASGAQGNITASVSVDLGDVAAPKGLIEKVDVLAEIPYVVKTVVNYVAGTKPYIYQWLNKAKLSVTGPDSLIPGLAGGLEIDGYLYNEATFIS
ncbi:oxidative stress survival Svf1-like protein [Athelia psychrophila]|uniref:Oxidative stress survival Svf1-like protein n=1 Tax=Athelia psychrophila TaxID=1759441 RepID=A0A166MCR9_9AGAM|nr:oxidative stress survival Svf1-like protein [Fibularhizoctonia sp. CBS 109695]